MLSWAGLAVHLQHKLTRSVGVGCLWRAQVVEERVVAVVHPWRLEEEEEAGCSRHS